MTAWFKGNTHTHTLNSDGDSSPGEVAHWYRDHGYDFLVLSDHNYLTSVDELQRELDRESERLGRHPMLLIPGEEVTDAFEDDSERHELHVNTIDTAKTVGAQGGSSVVEVLQRCIDAVRGMDGLPVLNHPNFRWSVTVEHIASLHGLTHFEIWNGHPLVHNPGGGGRPGLEEMWDALLSAGHRLFGVGVDDAHHFKDWGPQLSNPGRGWVVARADHLSREEVVGSLRRGDFYVSTGVELEEVASEDHHLRLRIRQVADFVYTTTFFGKGGAVLHEDHSLGPDYRLADGDLYVRARVTSSGGAAAWTQPLFGDGAGR
ncbi:MAG: CehA/McbA family metallohydrolase [Acidimicrobiia bacterium]